MQVYFLPVAADMWDGDADVPGHPALRTVADSEQYLTSRYRYTADDARLFLFCALQTVLTAVCPLPQHVQPH